MQQVSTAWRFAQNMQNILVFTAYSWYQRSATSWTNERALQSAPPESLRTDLAVFTQHSAQSKDVTSLPLSFSEIVLLQGEGIFLKTYIYI